MNHLLRLLWLRLTVSRRSRLEVTDVCVTPMRVRLSDLDVLRHMNNGVYLSLMDLGRVDFMLRSGMAPLITRAGLYPVVVQQTITYRKSLELGQRYDLETRIAGYDDNTAVMEQRFVVGGEIYARAWVRARFLRRSGGGVGTDELRELLGVDGEPAGELPEWFDEWAEGSRLPSARAAAPSTWA
jgi:YbgC/YbaW family acyl-CoA thioester hydrolase